MTRLRVSHAHCLEKTDLLNLYKNVMMRQPSADSASQAQQSEAAASAAQRRRRPTSNDYQSGGPSLMDQASQNWQLLLVLGLIAAWWFNSAGGGGSGGEEAYTPHSNSAYLTGKVSQINTHENYLALLKQHQEDTGLPVVIDFFSHSCQPCRMIAPTFKKLAHEYAGQAVFVKVDVNRNYETSRYCRVQSMPTFQFYLNGKKRQEFSGADSGRLRELTSAMVRQSKRHGTYVGVEVTADSLSDFYTEHDKSKADSANELLVSYAGKLALLMRVLKKKYGATPAVSDIAPPAQAEEDVAPKEATATPVQFAGVSMAQLKAEILRREQEDEEEEDEDDDLDMFLTSPLPKDKVERVVIVGGGPAGLSAAIYCARAGLDPVLIAPVFGGQLLAKGVDVENYPGVMGEDATGRGLVSLMRRQAYGYQTRLVNDVLLSVDLSTRPFALKLNASDHPVLASSIIVATGAETRWLNIPGEEAYKGHGVSACATCDGFLFRDRHVVVIGGGDTAMEDALVLARTSSRVTVIHRRNSFRASHILATRVLDNDKITVLWDTVATKFIGKDAVGEAPAHLTHVELANTKTAKTTKLSCSGAFVAIGHDPLTSLFPQLAKDEHGYLLLPSAHSTQTSLPGVFAAGDVADKAYRQAVTSAGTGAAAALDTERWLSAGSN